MNQSTEPNPHSDLPASGVSTEIQTAPGDSVSPEPKERPLPFGVYRGNLKKSAPATEPEPEVAPK